MGTRMSPGSALSLHVELFLAWGGGSMVLCPTGQGEAQGCGKEENPVLPAPGEVLDSGVVERL